VFELLRQSPHLFVWKVPFEVPHDCAVALFMVGMYRGSSPSLPANHFFFRAGDLIFRCTKTPQKTDRHRTKRGRFFDTTKKLELYRFGIFGLYSVGISQYLPYRYRRKIRSVHFGIKKGAVPPFFLKWGAMAPFLRSSNPLSIKRGEERGEVYKKGGDRYWPKYRKSSKSDTSKIPIPKKLPVTPRYL